MKIIKFLSDRIEEELNKAECYAKSAIEYKESFADVAKVCYGISVTHLDMVKILHEQVVAAINAYSKEHNEIPQGMELLYEYRHQREIEQAAAVRNLQDLYTKNII